MPFVLEKSLEFSHDKSELKKKSYKSVELIFKSGNSLENDKFSK